MPDTGFWVPGASIDRLPPLYTTDPGTGKPVVDDPPSGQVKAVSGLALGDFDDTGWGSGCRW
jgi:hypothetical protein